MLEENTIVANRYLLIRLLGRGGFSEVWLASDKMTSVHVALKVYAPGTGLDDEGIELFAKEFALVFDLNHSNLLKPTHYDYFERMPYLILPYCEKGSTLKLVGHLTETEAWTFLKDVCDGLDFLHSRVPPVIHQDIKPDNILIDSSGRFVITDFGISTRIRSTLRKSVNKVTSSGGTLAYMGPERFGANPSPIMASDIYSLGATMYELLTGDAPFGEHGGLLQKNGAEIPQIEGTYSKALKEIIYKCLSKETWERPTAKQVAEYAKQALEGKQVKIVGNPAKPQQRKNRIWAISGGIVVLLLTCLSIILISGSPEKNNAVYEEYARYVHIGDSLQSVGLEEGEDYEQEFVKALTCYEQALEHEGEISQDHATLNVGEKIDDLQKKISKAYNDLLIKAGKMREYNEYTAAEAFSSRADNLKNKVSGKFTIY